MLRSTSYDQTARISLQILSMSKSAETKLNRAARTSSALANIISKVSTRSTLDARYRRCSPALPRRLRFGEAVSTETQPNPQEEKNRKMTFSLLSPFFLQYLGVSETFGTISPSVSATIVRAVLRVHW